MQGRGTGAFNAGCRILRIEASPESSPGCAGNTGKRTPLHGQLYTSPKCLIPPRSCTSLPLQTCTSEPLQMCAPITEVTCEDIPEEVCETTIAVTKEEECIDVPEEQCETVTEDYCHEVYEKQCKQVYGQYKPVCTSVPVQKCVKKEKQVK